LNRRARFLQQALCRSHRGARRGQRRPRHSRRHGCRQALLRLIEIGSDLNETTLDATAQSGLLTRGFLGRQLSLRMAFESEVQCESVVALAHSGSGRFE
jgi:hypothetical protein